MMELLIVIAVILVLTVVAIPNWAGMKMQTNETSAIEALRSVYESQVQYQANYPTHGFACSLSQLGGRPHATPATPERAQLLPDELASSGHKSGYVFTIEKCTAAEAADQARHVTFEVTAVPQMLGKTGHRGFCMDERGELMADPLGGTHCTQTLQ